MDPDPHLQRQILQYLQAHPDAGDTVEGVCDWWLASSGKEDRKRVERVLRSMVSSGLLSGRYLPDGRLIFRRI